MKKKCIFFDSSLTGNFRKFFSLTSKTFGRKKSSIKMKGKKSAEKKKNTPSDVWTPTC